MSTHSSNSVVSDTKFCGYCMSYCNVISNLSEFLGRLRTRKSPGALILKGLFIFPGLLWTLLDYPDGGRRRIEKASAGRAAPRFRPVRSWSDTVKAVSYTHLRAHET